MKYQKQIAASVLAVAGPVLAQGPWWQNGGQPVVTVVEHVENGHTFTAPGIPATATTIITAAASTAVTSIITASSPATSPSTTTTSSSTTSSTAAQSLASGGSATVQPPATTPAPSGGGSNGGGTGGGAMTISIVNSYSTALSLGFDSNAGGPVPMGTPSATTIGQAATTFYSFPTGWAGRIYVGKTTNSANSKIEGSVTGPPDMDASYVDGYSVPIVCKSAGKVSGCNTELFGYNGNYCNQTDHSLSDFTICLNPKVDHDDGQADPFFAPCAGKAYTFPSDNGANYANVDVTTNCCIGSACNTDPEPSSSKRDLTSKREAELEAHAHGRHEKRWNSPRSHVHRLVRDAKLKR